MSKTKTKKSTTEKSKVKIKATKPSRAVPYTFAALFLFSAGFGLGVRFGGSFELNKIKLSVLQPSKKILQALNSNLTQDEVDSVTLSNLEQEIVDEATGEIAKNNHRTQNHLETVTLKPAAMKGELRSPAEATGSLNEAEQQDKTFLSDMEDTINEEISKIQKGLKNSPHKSPEGVKVASTRKIKMPARRKSKAQASTTPVKVKYTIQVSSYRKLKAAQNKVNALKSLGLDAFHSEAVVKSLTWYRVNVGHFERTKQARAYQPTLHSTAGLKTSTVQNLY